MMENKGFWRFSIVLRVLMGLCALAYLIIYLFAWGLAFMGETELVFEFIDIDGSYPLSPLQMLAGIVSIGLIILALIMIFWTSNQFLSQTQKRGFFAQSVAKSLKGLGKGMIVFWLGMTLSEDFLPWYLTRRLDPDLQIDLEWFPFDLNIIIMLLAFVLLLTASALEQARLIDQDNKQII